MIDFAEPAFTPNRPDIAKYSPDSKTPENIAIRKEADRRFEKTLQYSKASEFIAGVTAPSKPAEIFEGIEVYDTEAEEDMETLSYANREIHAPQVLTFLKQATALKIKANLAMDEYMADKRTFQIDPQDPVRRAIKRNYMKAVEEIAYPASPIAQKLADLRGQYPNIEATLAGDDEYDDSIPRRALSEYEVLTASLQEESRGGVFESIDKAKYRALAERIADSCAANSYLEQLFGIFIPENQRDFEVLYPEKLARVAKGLKRPEISPELRQYEERIRQHIKTLYPEADLPEILYIDKSQEKVWLARLGAKVLGPKWSKYGAGFIPSLDYEGIEIPINVAFMIMEPELQPIDNAWIVFEELYHASGNAYKDKILKGTLSWGGFTQETKGQTLFEEGLATEEARRYFDANFHAQATAPGTFRDQRERLARGEKIEHKLPIFVNGEAGFVVRKIISGCDKDAFLGLLRKARTNDQEALSQVKAQVDQVFGIGIYDYLSKLHGDTPSQVRQAIQRLKLLPSQTFAPRNLDPLAFLHE